MEGLSKEVKTQKAIGVVKPLVLMQKGEFREGLKRNWTVSLETGVMIGADAVQRLQRAEANTRPRVLLLLLLLVSDGGGEELVLEYRGTVWAQISCAGT